MPRSFLITKTKVDIVQKITKIDILARSLDVKIAKRYCNSKNGGL